MKKFKLKIACFILPFVLSYLGFLFFGSEEKGDLLRIGYLIDKTKNYREKFQNDFSKEILYTEFSNINGKRKFDLFTIGDSFSQQKGYGYQNYLSEKNISVLHYNKSCNSLKTLYSFIKGDFFEKLQIKYVLIQSAERYILSRSNDIQINKTLFFDDLIGGNKNGDIEIIKKTLDLPKFFSPSIVKFPLNFLYHFDDNAFFSKVYRVKTSKQLFTIGNKELLFSEEDYKNAIDTNKDKIENLNKELNLLSKKLKQKGVKLIVLPSPDKYDIYYKYFKSKEKYPEPIFFEYLSKYKKEYIFINSKKILNEIMEEKKDLYFFDDTHWSPIATKLISKKIKEIIMNDNQ
ncbi:acetyltransferase AlgX (SGNH hydrolase-like protein) [Lutibacter sp. Hel_I_33_5]|uniref:alginate O-acetyltransferase AlgX-related protein n=1 Tax=Lutibacter sp. Hel_I_33_5 TaxID=1566289 RepID=UPI0011AA6F66|nr:hypothetical protein [Lutibacter sp. Hel_I_33_5]TVZ56220.1 acetyltransferase AlgX (SGNH hydrolase-like protein) [Lutibacter sp. Hel_I_33_5]